MARFAEERIFGNMPRPPDFRLKITASRNGFRWEIYRDGNPVWVERSLSDFDTEGEASRDGARAIQRLQNREAQTRNS